MSNELGLKNTFREKIYEPLQNHRGNAASGGLDISLKDFCKANNITNSDGDPVDFPDLYNEFGVDPQNLTLDNLLSVPGDSRFLAPEVIRDFIYKGFMVSPWYREACASSVNVDSLTVVSPWIQFDDTEPQDTKEGETFPESTITYGDKSVKCTKSAIALMWTDEFLLSVKIPILQPYLARVGVQLGAKLNSQAVTTLINGDQTGGSDSCAVIGVNNTTSKFQYKDFITCWTRGSLIANNYNFIVTNEEVGNEILNISQFTVPYAFGNVPTLISSKNRIVPTSINHWISSSMADDQVMLLDPASALTEFVFMPLRVESERIVMKQISGTAVSTIVGFGTIMRHARVIMDSSKAFSGYAFPSYMDSLL
jgi:hypothetical protein